MTSPLGCFRCSGTDHWADNCPELLAPPAKDHKEHLARIAKYVEWCNGSLPLPGRITPAAEAAADREREQVMAQGMRQGKEKRMSTFPSTREAIREKFAGRNRAVIDAAQWFAYDHLAGSPARAAGTVFALNPRAASAAVAELAFDMIDDLPDSPELTHALRRLIEAKDCLVRAAIAAQDGQPS